MGATAEPKVAMHNADVSHVNTAVLAGHLKMGGKNPRGEEINANNRYLTFNGRPWMPAMGEFHYSRYPRAQWDEELLKMKSGGIDIVASYVFWNHHEEAKGEWEWSGDRDLHAFVELCGKRGLLCVVRLGPWAHGEARNGGFPDWLLKECGGEVRKEAEPYMTYARELYRQIAAQTKGLLWKDGGPVIGVQLDNELTRNAPHILHLKQIARELGFDVPLYTMTGWGGAEVPQDEVLPLWGGYPDAFWDDDVTGWDRSARLQYLFAVERDAPTIGLDANPAGVGSGNVSAKTKRNPYLTCEIGGGMQVSYRRRPVIEPEDVAAIALVKIGSGSNLTGYYMYHGGAHPIGRFSTLNESRASGYPNDLPVISYDFQAPLGQYGQRRGHFDLLRQLHLFLRDFGAELAPMRPEPPAQPPRGADDLHALRWAVRSDGRSGFVFINNYQRIEPLPPKTNVQFSLRLKSGSLTFPLQPVTIPSGASMIWPFNMDLAGTRLIHATAQLLCRVGDTFVFFAQPGIVPEFAFDDGKILRPEPGLGSLTAVGRAKLVVLTSEQACQAYKDGNRFVLSPALVMFDGEQIRLRSRNAADLWADILADGQFKRQTIAVAPRAVKPVAGRVKEAGPLPGPGKNPMQPDAAAFTNAEVWQVSVPADALTGVVENYLRVHYVGDVARAFIGERLVDDDYYFGRIWEIGLKRFAPDVLAAGMTLKILPLHKDLPVYIPKDRLPDFAGRDQAVAVRDVTLEPEYEAVLRP
jgi:hypothetical protein